MLPEMIFRKQYCDSRVCLSPLQSFWRTETLAKVFSGSAVVKFEKSSIP